MVEIVLTQRIEQHGLSVLGLGENRMGVLKRARFVPKAF